jgi:hypothetical protein
MPTQIYSYGASAPVEGLESVRAQMRLAHRYRNVLVSLEIKKRARVERALLRVDPRLSDVEKDVRRAEAALAAARAEIDAARAASRRRVVSPTASERVAEILAERRVLHATRKRLRQEAFRSDAWGREQERIDAWLYPRQRRLRAAVVACGLYWGTYLVVEDSCSKAHKGAPPRFRRWNGHGKVAVQIQKGMGVMDLLGCDDSRLRLRRGDETRPSRASALVRNGPRRGLPRLSRPERLLGDHSVSIRIGSRGRAPIFARVPIRLHRPLPPSARVKWAWLTVSRLGSHEVWRMQFVLADVPAQADRATSGAVGIDVGWRMIGEAPRVSTTEHDHVLDGRRGEAPPERRLRVASWLGSDGASGELSLSAGWLDQMQKTRDIRSIRDQGFDAARASLSAFLASREVPAWLREASASIALWKAPSRLAALAIRWNREAPGDAGMDRACAALWTLRRRNLHLLEYEANLRDQLQASRLDHYRKFAAAVRRRYVSIFVEKIDLRAFHVVPEAEEAPVDGALREHVRDAAISLLLGCLKESGASTVKAAWTTRTCGLCGHDNEWEDQSPLVLTCAGCGAVWDQDANARGNILRAGLASASAVSDPG